MSSLSVPRSIAGPVGSARVTEQLAGFAPRLGAALLDDLLLVVTGGGFFLASGLMPSAIIMVAALAFAYRAILDGTGGTLGKRALHLRVVNDGGVAPGIGAGMRRTLLPAGLGLVAALTGPAGAHLHWVAFADGLSMIRHPAKQTWHDRMAGTYVITTERSS